MPFAILMYGVAAFVGSVGFARDLLQALFNQDVGTAAAAGLAFSLIAVLVMHTVEGRAGRGVWKRVRAARTPRGSTRSLRWHRTDHKALITLTGEELAWIDSDLG